MGFGGGKRSRFVGGAFSRFAAGAFVLTLVCVLPSGCDFRRAPSGPSIELTRVPPASEGGRDKLDIIEGKVIGGGPRAAARFVCQERGVVGATAGERSFYADPAG